MATILWGYTKSCLTCHDIKRSIHVAPLEFWLVGTFGPISFQRPIASNHTDQPIPVLVFHPHMDPLGCRDGQGFSLGYKLSFTCLFFGRGFFLWLVRGPFQLASTRFSH
jgi:hypothetical protein